MHLKQQNEIDSRQWQRKVRSEPLLKLRAELAVMATKLSMLVTDTRSQHYRSNITEEEKNKELERAVEDLEAYLANGDLLQTLNLQYDAELLELVESIQSDYLLLFEYAREFGELKAEERQFFRGLSQKMRTGVPESQELINKKLEKL